MPGTLPRRNIRPTTAANKTPAQSNYVKLQKRVRERNRSLISDYAVKLNQKSGGQQDYSAEPMMQLKPQDPADSFMIPPPP